MKHLNTYNEKFFFKRKNKESFDKKDFNDGFEKIASVDPKNISDIPNNDLQPIKKFIKGLSYHGEQIQLKFVPHSENLNFDKIYLYNSLLSINIFKNTDDYYLVCDITSPSEDFNYKCDQLDGLFNCLNYIIKYNK